MRRMRWAVAIIALSSFSGCFDLLQEIWINQDGTARMVIDFAVPRSLMQLAGHDPITRLREQAKATETQLKQDPAVTKFAFRDFEEGGQRHLVYELEVNDATKLPALYRRALEGANAAQEPDQRVNLTFELARSSAGTLEFLQRIGGAGEGPPPALMGAMLSGHYFTVRLHAPEVRTANGVVNEPKDVVEWKIPIAELVSGAAQEKVLKAELRIGPPIWMWAIVLGVPALLLLLAVSAMKRRRAAGRR